MKKLQNKISMILVLTIILVAATLSIVSMVEMGRSATETSSIYLTNSAKIAADYIEKTITTYTYTVNEMASAPILTSDTASVEELKNYLNEKVSQYYMRSAGILDKNGNDLVNGGSYANEAFFKEAYAGKAYMSTPYITSDKKDMYIAVSAPIYQNGTPAKVLYFFCDSKVLQDAILAVSSIAKTGDAYMLDKNGTTIAYQDVELVLNQENIVQSAPSNPDDEYMQSLFPVEQEMIAGNLGFATYKFNGGVYFQAYAPVPGTDGWSIALTVERSEMMQPAEDSANLQFFLTLGIIIIGFIVSRIIGKSISKPITLCSDRLKLLAQGDLKSETPTVPTKDETKVLADSTAELVKGFNYMISDTIDKLKMIADGDLRIEKGIVPYRGDFLPLQTSIQQIIDSLNYTMSQIVLSCGEVSAGSDQVAKGASILAQGVTEQASSVQELSATLGDVSVKIGQTAENSKSASEISRSAREKLLEGRSYMDQLTEAMSQIDSKSVEISKIVKTIDDIAFQTNILALNAAVEAARAGEAGKGFAVVADEVRNLANKSAEAAKTTTALIEGSVDAASKGSQLTGITSDTLSEVMERAQESATFIKKIAEDAQSEAKAIREVTLGIEQISCVIQTNSATSEESAAAAEELSSQASIMRELISKFKVK